MKTSRQFLKMVPEPTSPVRIGLRRVRRRWREKWGTPTSFARLSPTFLLVGEMKCGTNSLYYHLTRHPSVIGAITKEIFFFDLNFARGELWYRSHFSLASRRLYAHRRYGADPAIGEATTNYFFHPAARDRIRAFDPDMKIIVLLRDPVERAYSHYQHSRARGREPFSFEEAVEREAERIHSEAVRMADDPTYSSFSHLHHSYLARGRYIEQIEAWCRLFPAEQILILKAEDLFDQPAGVVSVALRFLGLPEVELPDYPIVNRSEYSAMSAQARDALRGYFEPYNRRLYDYVGRDFAWPSMRTSVKTVEAGAL